MKFYFGTKLQTIFSAKVFLLTSKVKFPHRLILL